MTSPRSSDGRVWVITGTSTGFGRALAEGVIARGDRLVATARRPETIADLVALAPERVRAIALDVTVSEQVRAAVAAAHEAFGRIDVLVNNAGYGLLGAVEEVTDGQIRAQFETNVFGLFDVTRAALPLLRAQGGGHILMISSVAGQVGTPGLGIYDASKFAVEGFSEALAQEVAPFNIKVTLIEPGAFRTDWAGRSMPQAEPIEVYQQTAGYVRGALAKFNGQQPGDPAKAAQAMIAVVEAAEPPLRLPLGGDAVGAIRQKIEQQLQELSEWEALSTSTNFGA